MSRAKERAIRHASETKGQLLCVGAVWLALVGLTALLAKPNNTAGLVMIPTIAGIFLAVLDKGIKSKSVVTWISVAVPIGLLLITGDILGSILSALILIASALTVVFFWADVDSSDLREQLCNQHNVADYYQHPQQHRGRRRRQRRGRRKHNYNNPQTVSLKNS